MVWYQSILPLSFRVISQALGQSYDCPGAGEVTPEEYVEVNYVYPLTHWGRVTHICIGNFTIIGWDNGLPPGRRQAIIWTNAGIWSIGPLGTNFNVILIENLNVFIQENALENVVCKMAVILFRGRWVKNDNIAKTNAKQTVHILWAILCAAPARSRAS